MPGAGIEPARLAAGDFESPASTNFTTRARGARNLDKRVGVERNSRLYAVFGLRARGVPALCRDAAVGQHEPGPQSQLAY